MKRPFILISLILTIGGVWSRVDADSGALTLIDDPSGRSSALGSAFIAGHDDSAAFAFNPGSLATMKSGHGSFMYHRGLVEDTYGSARIVVPTQKAGSFGLSLGYYDAGDLIYNDGTVIKTVNAQRDVDVSLGYGRSVGRLGLGLTAKYLSSELAETARANAYAADLGAHMAVNDRLRLGAAIQNLGSKLKYIEEGDDLPTRVGLGAAITLIPRRYPTTLYVDLPYYVNESELRFASGLEVVAGVLALRGGYKTGSDLAKVTLGAGFMLGRASLDYSFGMAQKLDAEHRVSFGLRFGGAAVEPLVQRNVIEKTQTLSATQTQSKESAENMEQLGEKETLGFTPENLEQTSSAPRQTLQNSYEGGQKRVYTIRPGDTLGSIAERYYGDRRMWTKVYLANRHLIEDSRRIEVGQKIILP